MVNAVAINVMVQCSETELDHYINANGIIRCIEPLNEELVAFHNAAGLPWNSAKQALYLQGKSLFIQESFNPRFFSIYYDDTLHLNEQTHLEKKLFYDPLLSGNGKISCAACHDPDKAFTDGLVRSIAFDGNKRLARNAPSLWNVAYQRAFFHDGRAYQLEQQVLDVIPMLYFI